MWSSKMQTLTALLTTEAKYVALSTTLHDLIPTMELSKDITQQDIIMQGIHPKI